MEIQPKHSVVVIGGGTGTHALLQGLKKYTDSISLKVIVTTADSGGSTGRLRDEFGYLPVGDVRMALSAMAKETDEYADILRQLFLYRFSKGEGLRGHTLGNLFLVALTDILGNEEAAIHAASKVLATCGEVIPVTTSATQLTAQYDSGITIEGEHEIDVASYVPSSSVITQLSLKTNMQACTRALSAINEAEVIVLGPGDLYTSILANCVVGGVREALCATKAKTVFVANLMSRNGQTKGMGTALYLSEIHKYIGFSPEYMIMNTAPLRPDLLELYAKDGEYPVVQTYTGDETEVIQGDFVAHDDVVLAKGDVLKRSLIRHDAHKLAHAIMQLV
jgi:uncharacterized cofD-like protein